MLSLKDVQRIAHLARIELSAPETAAMQQSLNGILQVVDRLCAVDTAGVSPMSHPQDLVQRLREDAVTEGDDREAFQAVAPQVEAGLYLVPKVLE